MSLQSRINAQSDEMMAPCRIHIIISLQFVYLGIEKVILHGSYVLSGKEKMMLHRSNVLNIIAQTWQLTSHGNNHEKAL